SGPGRDAERGGDEVISQCGRPAWVARAACGAGGQSAGGGGADAAEFRITPGAGARGSRRERVLVAGQRGASVGHARIPDPTPGPLAWRSHHHSARPGAGQGNPGRGRGGGCQEHRQEPLTWKRNRDSRASELCREAHLDAAPSDYARRAECRSPTRHLRRCSSAGTPKETERGLSQAAAVTSGKAPWDVRRRNLVADLLRSGTLRGP